MLPCKTPTLPDVRVDECLPVSMPSPARLYAYELYGLVADELVEESHRVAAAAYACDGVVG